MKFNGLRVGVSVFALMGLAVTLLCPWWRYRSHEDLGAVLSAADQDRPFLESKGLWPPDLETHVGPVSLWSIQGYEVRDWLPFNIIQAAGILAAWGWGFAYARGLDKAPTE